jgi:hypothetical protein
MSQGDEAPRAEGSAVPASTTPSSQDDILLDKATAGVAGVPALSPNRPQLTAEQADRSAMTLIRKCAAEEKKVILERLLDTYHAIVDIHSLEALYTQRAPGSSSPPSSPIPSHESKSPVPSQSSMSTRTTTTFHSAEDESKEDGAWAVIVTPNLGFNLGEEQRTAVRAAVQVSRSSRTNSCLS